MLLQKLRNGTFIVPATGERSRRQFTLRNPPRTHPRPTAPTTTTKPTTTMVPARCSPPFFSRDGASKRLRAAARRTWRWLDSDKGRGVLKCTLAYAIASLWTFWTPLSNMLGKPDGKHVVATITVYFHPARTAGSMIEASAIACVAVVYAELVSVLSMAVSVLLGSVLGRVALAHAVVLVVFIGGSFGFLGWVKQRMNNPSVNVACTLASLAIISVVTKENATYTSVFSNTKLVQVLNMLIFGISTTAAVNLLVWRVAARALLRQVHGQVLHALGDMLAMITHGFLSGSEEELASAEFRQASTGLVFGLRGHDQEPQGVQVRALPCRPRVYNRLDKAVFKSMETLAQSIGGLRSAADTQFELLKEPGTQPPSGAISPGTSLYPSSPVRSFSYLLRSGKDRFANLCAIDEASNEGSEDDDSSDRARSREDSPATRHGHCGPSGRPPTSSSTLSSSRAPP